MVDLFKFVVNHFSLGAAEIQAPSGWESMAHTIARDSVYHGTTVSYTLDFAFVKDGREYLQTVYKNFGINAEILLTIYEWEPNQHEYFESYAGLLNLAEYEVTALEATTNAEQTGFIRQVLNLEDVQVDLTSLKALNGNSISPFTQVLYYTEFHYIQMHSKATIKSFEGNATVAQPEYDFRPVSREEETSGTLYIGWDEEPINNFNAFSYGTGLDFNKGANELIPFEESATIKVEYKLDFNIKCSKSDGFFKIGEVDFFLGINLTGPAVNDVPATPGERIFSYNENGLPNFLNKDVQVQGERTYNVLPGDKLYFFGYAGVFDTSGKLDFEWIINLTGDNYIRVTGVTKTAPTLAFGMMAHEAYTRVLQSLTGRNTVFYSELLGRVDTSLVQYPQDGELAYLMVTNGSQLRGFSLAERPIFASLKELFNSTAAIKPIGLGVELTDKGQERMRLEGLDYFYTDEVVLELGPVDSKMSIAQEYYYNQTELGYKKWASNETNSLDEINTKQIRTTSITALKATYSRVSDYISSSYLIESVRRQQYASSAEKEGSDDKTNFWICLLRKPDGYFETERNQRLIVANNMLDPDSIYNIFITPMRNFIRHAKVLAAGLLHLESKEISFNEGNANYLAETQYIGEPKSVIENMPITGKDLGKPYWIAEYHEFTAPMPLFQRKKLEAKPYGKIGFINTDGEHLYGYIKEIKTSLVDRNATFKLLRASD